MENISVSAGVSNAGGLKAILLSGLAAGILDITAASLNIWINSGRGPMRTFQSVAGGLYGAETFNGGYQTAAIGLALHFLIALSAAAVYFLASRKLRFMIDRPILSGAAFGIAVWLFMYIVVLPLSAWKVLPGSLSSVLIGIFIHIFFVGLPIALITRRFSK